MGDRISISFRDKYTESVVLFSHWGGMEFYKKAVAYILGLSKGVGKRVMNPLDRLEPCTVMVDFIRYITKGMDRVESDLYLGVDEFDGDNSDNGHFTIDVNNPLGENKQ